MTAVAGYSGTPLAKKLGIKPSFRIKNKNAPVNYCEMLGPLPEDVALSPRLSAPVDLWHLFASSRRDLVRQLAKCLGEIRQNGMIWVSWPKKSSAVASDLTEDVI